MLTALVGLPGSGKSTIGRRLASRLGQEFVDSDRAIEAHAGCTIAEFFARQGEVKFRDLEQDILARLIDGHEGVIATGGGVVLRDENRRRLSGVSLCIYLRCQPEDLAPRIREDGRRPLMAGVDTVHRMRQLFHDRDALYASTAHVSIDGPKRQFERVLRVCSERLAPPARRP